MGERCIFFFDFDNTLYSHKTRQIPASALEALAALRQQGHLVALISGRGNESFPMFRREFDVLPELICLLNGQIIYDGDRVAFERHIPAMDMDALFQRAKAENIVYGGYVFAGQVLSGVNDRVRQVWTDFQGEMPPVRPDFEEKEDVYQASLYITEEEQHLFSDLLPGYVTNWSHRYLCNLISRKAGKSRSIRWCLDHFGIAPDRAYAFGDGYNDMDMLEAVPHGVAMADGFEPLKAIAEFIAPPADENGIHIALQHYGFL